MKRQQILTSVLALGLLLALAAGLSLAQGPQSFPRSHTALRPQQPCPDTYEPNEDFTGAWPLSPGKIHSYICDGSDLDYFKFQATAGSVIRLHLYNLPADYDLCLFDPAQVQVVCSENSGVLEETIEKAASSSGVHYALVYGVQGACDSANSYTFELQVIEQELPDLIITGVWSEEGYYPQMRDICYQIMNIGDAVAPAGHETVLSIDGTPSAGDTVTVTLAPGERLNRCFTLSWQCSSPEDTVKACADNQNYIAESDDTNNCITETWQCDTTPPTITSGPIVSDVLQTSAVISWTTDEDSDSVVEFGRYAGEYEDQESDATQATEHEMPLTGLNPATVYHYIVKSTDGSSNTVTSGRGFFETEPEQGGEPPSMSPPTVARIEGNRELYRITVPISDALGIERVEFYMDERLIGIDYSADLLPGAHLNAAPAGADAAASQYEFCLDPATLKMSRTGFFGTQHMILAKAFSLGGLVREQSLLYAPGFEFADIDFLVWPNHHLTHYVDGPGGTLPAGTTINVSVHASESAWWESETLGVFQVRDYAVNRVVFEIDGTTVYTSYPSDENDDFDHAYSWDVGGLGVGTYRIRVRAYARDGGITPYRDCTLTVEQGEPGLQVSRSVSRVDNYFRVRLTLENEGTATAGVSRIRDNVTGFQAIIASTANYAITPKYFYQSQHCNVEIVVFTGTAEFVTLAPGESMIVEYLAVPILYSDSDTFEYGIGVRNELRIWDQGGFCRWILDRPGDVTSGGELLTEAIGSARESSDYLIVTHPRNLFRHTGSFSDVDALLSKMAELAQLKAGILGYVSVGGADVVLDQIREWGGGMRGSDGVDGHFLSNGYVLLVGEAGIIGSWNATGFGWRGDVHYTDLNYGDTGGDWYDPELIVGRVIGNNAKELMIPLQTSINNYRGEPNYHFTKSRALLVSGRGTGVTEFEQDVDDISGILRRLGSPFAWGSVTTKKQRHVEDVEGLDMTWVFTSSISTPGRDLLVYSDHCNAFGWSGVIGVDHFPIDFGERKPFALALCCKAGQYEDLGATGIAEAFLQNGAGVYIGATESSYSEPDNEAGTWFFERWADSSESIGQSFKALKRHLDGRDGWYWSAEYNLYGDPKYGLVSTAAGLAHRAEIASAEPVTSVVVVVPDYEVTTTVESEHRVRIPGGGMLLEEGKPQIPVFYTEVEYAQGHRVQDVILVSRSGLTTTTGLVISDASMITKSTATAPSSPGSSGEGWWPDPEQVFDWSIRENPDGSSTLVIKMYPFYYNSLTTNVEFYKNYDFDIQVISSTVQIAFLTTDENAYSQGDEVLIDLSLNSAGDAQDVIVNVVVKTQTSEVVDGLLLQSLKSLTGTASFSPQWDSTGFEPGYYTIEAEVRDSAGNVLDRKMKQFRLGIFSGEVTTFTATPTFFHIGDTISVSLVFSNTGTVPITGTAIIQVQDGSGEVVEDFSHAVTNLAPANSITFDDAWDTSGAAEGPYTVVGYVLYDSRATSIETVTVSTETYIYLPIVLRNLQ